MPFSIEQFVADARALEGVRFLHQGRDPATGIDCINAPRYLVEKQGVKLPEDFDYGPYSQEPDGARILATMQKHLIEITPEEARAGDLYLFAFRRQIRHIGIRLDDAP